MKFWKFRKKNHKSQKKNRKTPSSHEHPWNSSETCLNSVFWLNFKKIEGPFFYCVVYCPNFFVRYNPYSWVRVHFRSWISLFPIPSWNNQSWKFTSLQVYQKQVFFSIFVNCPVFFVFLDLEIEHFRYFFWSAQIRAVFQGTVFHALTYIMKDVVIKSYTGVRPPSTGAEIRPFLSGWLQTSCQCLKPDKTQKSVY